MNHYEKCLYLIDAGCRQYSRYGENWFLNGRHIGNSTVDAWCRLVDEQTAPFQRLKEGGIGFQTRKLSIPATTGELTATLSSETPVKRAFGNEVLLHRPDAIDFSRVQDGKLPLLQFHDQKAWPIGYIESFRLDPVQKVTRGTLVFADTPESEKPRRLINQGVPLQLSIGYDLDPESAEYDPATDTYYFKWTPAEVSVLPIGADPTIGIGRGRH